MDSFAGRLKRERKALGFTQQKFGALGGVEANAQAMYESGARIPRSGYLVALWSSGIDVLYLISGRRTPLELDVLSSAERDIITHYRALSPTHKQTITQLTSSLSDGASDDR